MKKNILFWISYSDIMTSLFFVMLVLFVVSYAFFRSEAATVAILEEQKEEIEAIETALNSLDRNYFDFDEESKRYRLDIPVMFAPSKSNIYVVGEEILNELYDAGNSLYSRLDSLLEANNKAHLLLVIEGNTQRYANNWINNPDDGYRLSYSRALALYNFWIERGLNFRNLTDNYDGRFELIIAGSGYFGLNREPDGSPLNRRFTLQITSKYTLEAGN